MLSEERRQGAEVQALVESQLEIILFRTKVIEDGIFSTLEGRIASNQVALEGKFSERGFYSGSEKRTLMNESTLRRLGSS